MVQDNFVQAKVLQFVKTQTKDISALSMQWLPSPANWIGRYNSSSKHLKGSRPALVGDIFFITKDFAVLPVSGHFLKKFSKFDFSKNVEGRPEPFVANLNI